MNVLVHRGSDLGSSDGVIVSFLCICSQKKLKKPYVSFWTYLNL